MISSEEVYDIKSCNLGKDVTSAVTESLWTGLVS